MGEKNGVVGGEVAGWRKIGGDGKQRKRRNHIEKEERMKTHREKGKKENW